ASGRSLVRLVSSADRIYELYCLKTLRNIIEEAGYTEDKERRLAYDYPYRPSLQSYFYKYEGDNTFFFSHEESGCQLTLYYQPCIYVNIEDELSNGISLVRVSIEDSKKSPGKKESSKKDVSKLFYSPDFLLKRTDSYGTAYGIIDSKWRDRINNLKSLADMVDKYMHSIVDRRTWQPVRFMWLLQGKDDREYQPTYRRFSSSLFSDSLDTGAHTPSWLNDSLGIVRLTPASGKEELASILDTFLSPGAFIQYQ
ncbi:hypothetical protein IJT17_04640, partial [bacterium]|nr:hypothetical protein [bacterium]